MLRPQHPLASKHQGVDLSGKQLYVVGFRLFHQLHPLDLLFLCPGKCRLGRLMLKPLNHLIQPGQLLLLLLIALLLPGQQPALLLAILGIIPHITGQPFPAHLIDKLRHLVQKKPVMGHHHHRMVILPQILLQPLAGSNIQMIGGLIQKQNVRFFQQQPDKADLRLFSAGEGFQLPPFLLLGKTKAGKQTVILPLILKPLPLKGILRRTIRQKLLLHRPLRVRKDLLPQHPHGHLPGQ